MAVDHTLRDHQSWLGYLQPDGLVVSPAALVDSQASLDLGQASVRQLEFREFVDYVANPIASEIEREPKVLAVSSLQRLFKEFLRWPEERIKGLSASNPIPEALKIPLRDFGETLEPTFAFTHSEPTNLERPWMMLVQELPLGMRLDVPIESKLSGWSASPTRRFERLLRESEVPIGLLSNATQLQLIYAPRGENSGTLTFPVSAMSEISGRPILAAFHMLFSRYRLLAAPTKDRLPGLLQRSRDYQARVSTALAQQVLDALYELLRGFQSAHQMTGGELLRAVLADEPNAVYNGLLSVLMRLVFLLYAEDQGLMPDSDLYARNYSVHGLFQRLRNDAEQFPDTMEHRYGAWAQLLALFRAVYQGSQHPLIRMPAREGHLFDPQRFTFLEGRESESQYEHKQPLRLPLVPDGTIYRVLDKLLTLDGERLSYRTLDVEQIGSVYETMMGFRLELAKGSSIALKPNKKQGAPSPVSLDELLATKPADRAKFIQEQTDYKLPTAMGTSVKSAESVDSLLAALEKRIALNATPQCVATGTMLLVPTDERRRSGSHYTPRSLTEPIVRTTLEPVIQQLGDSPTPEQILNLKVCDPAVGSGAFLVESCRQLAEKLVAAWTAHGYKPYIPPDEDELLHARRLVAQRCLYGVDRNPMAVDLAKLSLWLTTLAKDHPFTFLDHSIRCGDSLVGLTRRQIVGFDLNPSSQLGFVEKVVRDRMDAVAKQRRTILDAGDNMLPGMKLAKLKLADESLGLVRMTGDAIVASFFQGDKPRARKEAKEGLFEALEQWIQKSDFSARQEITTAIEYLYSGESRNQPLTPFHWEIEYPEVFTGDSSGFDAIVGNPPFAGKNTMLKGNRVHYLDWLQELHEESHGNSDLVAHFFRRTYSILRANGCFGLIATNTIGQGDTRATGLRWICLHGGTIYTARKRVKWPGVAAVVVSVVHVCKGLISPPLSLDNHEVPLITAYLLQTGGHENPESLKANAGQCFQGTILLGMGFTFDDSASDGTANTLASMRELCKRNPSNLDRIFPYIGGDEVNNVPSHEHYRFTIDFRDFPLKREDLGWHWVDADERTRKDAIRTGIVPLDYTESVADDWPDLVEVLQQRVKPHRQTDNREIYRRLWWQHAEKRIDLYRAIKGLERVLVINCGATPHMSFAFLPQKTVFANTLDVFAYCSFVQFAILQSRVHEVWVRRESSSMKDDLRYTPTDCFESFPFPVSLECENIELQGRQYYSFRAELMTQNKEGLTKTYNKFHDPLECSTGVLNLREQHLAMDKAILQIYGWYDLSQIATCEFILDYDDEEDDELETSIASRRKKPWRYRWPDEFRDEVLARLLDLNKKRAEEERRTGAAAEAQEQKTRKPANKKPPKPAELFDFAEQERRCLVYLSGAWGKRVSRRALNSAVLLMLNDPLRIGLLEPKKAKKKLGKLRMIDGLDFALAELASEEAIVVDNSGAQQIIHAGSNAASYGEPSPEDVERINQVKQYFEQRKSDNAVQETETEIDASENLVPNG